MRMWQIKCGGADVDKINTILPAVLFVRTHCYAVIWYRARPVFDNWVCYPFTVTMALSCIISKIKRATYGRTDRQMCGQTSCHGIVRTMHTCCAVKRRYRIQERLLELGRFIDRRSAHIKRSENLTCVRSDSDLCVVATRRVTTVPLMASISPPQ